MLLTVPANRLSFLPCTFACFRTSLNGIWSIRPLAAAAVKSLELCPTLSDPIDGRPPGSPVPGILKAGTLEWVAISFSNVWKWKVKVKSHSHVQLLATQWTAAYQAPPSMGFSRQEYWSGVPLPSPLEFDFFPLGICFWEPPQVSMCISSMFLFRAE